MSPTTTLLHEELKNYRSTLGSFLGDEDVFFGSTFEEMLDQLVKGDEDLRSSTILFARTRVIAIRRELRNHTNDFYSPVQFHSFLVRYLFYKMLHAYSMRFDAREALPLDHHWLSRCYIKRFATPTERMMEFTIIEPSGKQKVIREDFFVHGRSQDGQGHFPLPMEHFFGLVEADYSQSMESGKFGTIQTDQGDNLTRLVMACYYIISQVRIPKKDVRKTSLLREAWNDKERVDYPQSIFDAVEDVRGLLNIATVNVPFELTIAPMVPVYTRQSSTGVKMRLFPIDKDKMAVFSERQNVDEVSVEMDTYNRQVSERAKRLGTFVIV